MKWKEQNEVVEEDEVIDEDGVLEEKGEFGSKHGILITLLRHPNKRQPGELWIMKLFPAHSIILKDWTKLVGCRGEMFSPLFSFFIVECFFSHYYNTIHHVAFFMKVLEVENEGKIQRTVGVHDLSESIFMYVKGWAMR